MSCSMFKGGRGVGNGYTILKGATEYVSAASDGSVGQIAIDVDKTRDICPHKVNDAQRWWIDILLGFLITHAYTAEFREL